MPGIEKVDLSAAEKERYARQLRLNGFGMPAQLKLKASSVLVVGAGGLGCPCLLYLNAAGVGHIGIADDDRVCLSNLQRQTLYNESDLNHLKAEVARIKLLERNTGTQITAYPVRLTPDNAEAIIRQYDLVIDASDNFYTRYLLNSLCASMEKPLIYGALFEFEGQVSTFSYKGGPGLNDLFPVRPQDGDIDNCVNAGVLGVLPGIIGTWQALEAIKILTGIGEVLSGKLMLFNALNNEISILNFDHTSGSEPKPELLEEPSFTDLHEIDWPWLLKLQGESSIQLIDVREAYEFEEFNIGGINLPLGLLDKKLAEINDQRRTVVICQTGARSKKGIEIIRNRYPDIEIYHLNKGLAGANTAD